MHIKNVYLSDDDADDRYFFKKAFDEVCSMHNLLMFDNNSALLEELEAPGSVTPDVIFIDLNMPSLNGLECLRLLKKVGSLKDAAVVIYSTIQSETFIEEVRQLGAAHFVKKPYDFYKLSNIIKYIVDLDTKDNELPCQDFVLSFESIKGKV